MSNPPIQTAGPPSSPREPDVHDARPPRVTAVGSAAAGEVSGPSRSPAACGQPFCCGRGPADCERAPSGQSDAAAERSAIHAHRGDGACFVCGGPWAKGGASFAARAAPWREVCSPECAASPLFRGIA